MDGPVNEPYWAGLREGVLSYQTCVSCGHRWLPGRRECPNCWSPEVGWASSAGTGKVISWVTYNRAMSPEFESIVPYTITLVELDEGPRVYSRLVETPIDELRIGVGVELACKQTGDRVLGCFRLRAGG